MRKQFLSLVVLVLSASIFFLSCQKEAKINRQREEPSAFNSANNAKEQSKKIYVGNVSELYAAINDPENSGGTIVLSEGTYLLSASYPKGGRLELQNNMNLIGQPGHPELVVIDVTGLPLSSFTLAGSTSRTGAIRMGDGRNSLEWITFQNDPAHTIRSLIQTDIIATSTTQIRVTHCIIKGSSIGLSILNRDPVANGRVLEADIEDNEIMDNIIPQFGSGIQIQNTNSSEAVLKVRMSRNYIHGNKAGMLVFNSSSQHCTLEVKSYNDKIENNGIGMNLNGGFILSATNSAHHNTLRFEGYATSIRNNTGTPAPPFAFPATGVHAAGGQSMPPFDVPGTAHYNELELSFNGCIIEDNAGSSQINAYGAHSFHSSLTPAGTNNATKIFLHGLSKQTAVSAMPSFPDEAAGTNTIAVYR